jgi:hypothetical protein
MRHRSALLGVKPRNADIGSPPCATGSGDRAPHAEVARRRSCCSASAVHRDRDTGRFAAVGSSATHDTRRPWRVAIGASRPVPLWGVITEGVENPSITSVASEDTPLASARIRTLARRPLPSKDDEEADDPEPGT